MRAACGSRSAGAARVLRRPRRRRLDEVVEIDFVDEEPDLDQAVVEVDRAFTTAEAGSTQTGTATVTDRFGEPFAGATVAFSEAGGAFSSATDTADADGEASLTYTTSGTPSAALEDVDVVNVTALDDAGDATGADDEAFVGRFVDADGAVVSQVVLDDALDDRIDEGHAPFAEWLTALVDPVDLSLTVDGYGDGDATTLNLFTSPRTSIEQAGVGVGDVDTWGDDAGEELLLEFSVAPADPEEGDEVEVVLEDGTEITLVLDDDADAEGEVDFSLSGSFLELTTADETLDEAVDLIDAEVVSTTFTDDAFNTLPVIGLPQRILAAVT